MRCTLGLDIHQRYSCLVLLLGRRKVRDGKRLLVLHEISWKWAFTFDSGERVRDDHLGFLLLSLGSILLRPELESFEMSC